MDTWKFATMALLATSSIGLTGCKHIEIPYFERLKPAEVCGGVPSECQPTSSQQWLKVANLDYEDPAAILGRSFSTIYETAPCMAAPIGSEDYLIRGESSVNGTLRRDGTSGFSAKASADLDEALGSLIEGLPQDAEAAAEAELRNVVTRASQSSIELTYFRIDLTTRYLDANLQPCLASLDGTDHDKVVTGVSVIETSGSWSSSRISEFVASFESSAVFQALDAEAKANWESNKDLALSGTFQPVRYIFAAAYRTR